MTNESKQRLMVWWVLWAAFQTGIFVIYHFLGGSEAQAEASSPDSPMWLGAYVPFVISISIRWAILPRVQTAQTALPLFIVGIAMAEATCFLGLFMFPAHKQTLFLASVLGIFQFVPYFAHRYFSRDDQDRSA